MAIKNRSKRNGWLKIKQGDGWLREIGAQSKRWVAKLVTGLAVQYRHLKNQYWRQKIRKKIKKKGKKITASAKLNFLCFPCVLYVPAPVTNSNKHYSRCIKPSTCPIVPVDEFCICWFCFILSFSNFRWGGARDTGTIDMDKFRQIHLVFSQA